MYIKIQTTKTGEKRPHQEDHRQRHPVPCAGDRRYQREHHLHHLPRRSQQDFRDQAPLPCHDHQEPQEVLHLRSAGFFFFA